MGHGDWLRGGEYYAVRSTGVVEGKRERGIGKEVTPSKGRGEVSSVCASQPQALQVLGASEALQTALAY